MRWLPCAKECGGCCNGRMPSMRRCTTYAILGTLFVGQARWASGCYPLLILSPQPKKSGSYHLWMIGTALFGLLPDFFLLTLLPHWGASHFWCVFSPNIVIISLPNPIISAKIEVRGAHSLIKRPLYFEFKPILHISEAVHAVPPA